MLFVNFITSYLKCKSKYYYLSQVFGNIPTFLGGNKPPQVVPEYQRPGFISEEPSETILYHTPVIKTVDAPDLTQVGQKAKPF
jgi:hypothetical protein